MNKISAVYKITNTVTNDFYIGSSKDVKRRWAEHKYQSVWNKKTNCPIYQDMKKYGVDKFVFEILAEVEIEQLKKTEQQFIEKLKPTYNQMNAKDLNVERYKEYQKEYKNMHREEIKEYNKSDKYKEYQKEYKNMHREEIKEYNKQYYNQLCSYKGETLTLNALSQRFRKAGISNPTEEAKKYLIKSNDK